MLNFPHNDILLVFSPNLISILCGGRLIRMRPSPSRMQCSLHRAVLTTIALVSVLTLSACGAAQNGPVSLNDALTSGGTRKCTSSTNVGGITTTSAYYIAHGVARFDSETTTDGKVEKSHLIIKDGLSYTWTDGAKSGYKMTSQNDFPPVQGQQNSGVPQPSTDQAPDNCTAWAVDESVLTIPSTITFTDLSKYSKP